jgi:uncharacterized protein (TIGR02452 family)
MNSKSRKDVLFKNLNHWTLNKQRLVEMSKDNMNRKTIKTPTVVVDSDKFLNCCPAIVNVYKGDWGDVLINLTRKYETTFVVLNMANAYVPGGGYLEGCPAQEENIFRRSDCHFNIIQDTNVSWDSENHHYIYNKHYQDLINAKNDIVYLDKKPRILFADNEVNEYKILPDDKIFPFYEMRSAAVDCSNLRFNRFNAIDMEKRIVAQFNTAKNAGLQHILLGAFGCGAFKCPPKIVAEIYKKTIQLFKNDFSVIAFAIYYPGYGPTDNYDIFKNTLDQC